VYGILAFRVPAEVEYVIVPEMGVFPFMKVTVPVGVTLGAVPPTVAIRVVCCPRLIVLGLA
jgi:hypothetical protein